MRLEYGQVGFGRILLRSWHLIESELNVRRVTTAEGEALSKKLQAGFIECSAKDNKNVGECLN